MVDKDRVEFLLKLADVHWRDYSERRSIEWKTNFGLWLALGTFSAFMFQHTTSLHPWLRLAISGILAVTFAVYAFVWKMEIKERNAADKAAAEHYWGLAITETKIPPAAGRTVPRYGGWPRTHLSQVILTLLFVILAIIATWAN